MCGFRSICAIASVVAICGCERGDPACRQDDAAASTNAAPVQGAVPAEKADDSPIAVRIDGRDIRRSDIIRRGKVMLTLNMNKNRKVKIGHYEQKYFAGYCRRAVRQAIGRASVSAYLAARGIQVPQAELDRVSKVFARKYGVRSRKLKRWHTIDDLKYMLGQNAVCLDQEIFDCASYDVATNDMIRVAALQVTGQDVTNRMRRIADYNLRMADTNALVFARATNVWKQVVARSLSFDDAAAKYSEGIGFSDDIEWGSFTKDQLEDEPAVKALLPTIKVGDITPPVESDGGLAILRRDESDNADIISFSRIFFRLPAFFEEESFDEAKAVVRDEMELDLVRKTLDDYAGRLKIEYPDGTNVMSKAVTTKEFND